LLADVYLELIGGRQPGFELAAERKVSAANTAEKKTNAARPPRPHVALENERADHNDFMQQITDPIWHK
jgi:DNA polymerase-3 subunit epsilon